MKQQNISLKYLVTSDHDSQWGLTIDDVGFQRINPNEVYPPDNHPPKYLFKKQPKGRILFEYQLLYITKGQGRFVSASCKRTVIKPGYFILLFPGERHFYSPDPDTGWDEYWIGFSGENIDNRVKAGFFRKDNPIFNVGLNDKIVELYLDAIFIAKEEIFGYQQVLAGIVNHLLGYSYSLSIQTSFEEAYCVDKVNEAKAYIIGRINDQIVLGDIAKHIGVSYSWFRRIFKRYTGYSPASYIMLQKIGKSKEMLTNSSYAIKEIAFQMGFENINYFSTTFKRNTGMTPVEYRDLTQGNTAMPKFK